MIDLLQLLLGLAVILLVARLILRSAFNREWHAKVQDIVDSLRKEKTFWRLMRGYYYNPNDDGEKYIQLGVNDVYRLYLRKMYGELTVGDFLKIKCTETDKRVKKTIKKGKNAITNSNLLTDEEKKREKSIEALLDTSEEFFSLKEIKEHFEEKIWTSAHYDKFLKQYLEILSDIRRQPRSITEIREMENFSDRDRENIRLNRYSCADIWSAKKKLINELVNLEWKSENQKNEPYILAELKTDEAEFYDLIDSLLLSKIETGKRTQLELNIEEMNCYTKLKWCLIDHSVWMITNEVNLIQIAGWRIFARLAN